MVARHSLNCKICVLNPEIREYIEESVQGGEEKHVILSRFPKLKLSTDNITNHMKHIELVQADEFTVEKLKKKLEIAYSDQDLDSFFNQLIPQLKTLVFAATVAAQQDFYEGSVRRAKDSTSILKNMLECLDYVTGFKSRISVDCAMDVLTSAGYVIQDNPRSQNAILRQQAKVDSLTYEEFKQFRAGIPNSNETTL